jgi:membrane protein DedA with SNARE-associated domain
VLERFLDWLAGLPVLPTYAVLMALSALENVFPPVPADVAVALGAFMARRGEISVVPLGVACWAANTASAVGMYYLARRHGRAFFREGWGRRFMPPIVLSALEEAYHRYGVFGIFLSRFLPGVRAAVTPFAGVVGMPPRLALFPAALASAVWYAFLAGTGYAVADNWEAVTALLGRANRGLSFVAAGAGVVAAIWFWRRLRREKRD